MEYVFKKVTPFDLEDPRDLVYVIFSLDTPEEVLDEKGKYNIMYRAYVWYRPDYESYKKGKPGYSANYQETCITLKSILTNFIMIGSAVDEKINDLKKRILNDKDCTDKLDNDIINQCYLGDPVQVPCADSDIVDLSVSSSKE